jgi:hypothetical protein
VQLGAYMGVRLGAQTHNKGRRHEDMKPSIAFNSPQLTFDTTERFTRSVCDIEVIFILKLTSNNCPIFLEGHSNPGLGREVLLGILFKFQYFCMMFKIICPKLWPCSRLESKLGNYKLLSIHPITHFSNLFLVCNHSQGNVKTKTWWPCWYHKQKELMRNILLTTSNMLQRIEQNKCHRQIYNILRQVIDSDGRHVIFLIGMNWEINPFCGSHDSFNISTPASHK